MASGVSSVLNDLWYCHSCQKHVVPNLTEYCCTLCTSGCIEAVNSTAAAENDAPEPMAYDQLPPLQPIDQLPPLRPLQQRLSDIDGGIMYGLPSPGMVGGSGGGRAPRVTRRPARRTHIAIHRVHNNGAPGNTFQSFINQFMQSLMGNGTALTGGALNIQVQPLLLTGNTGDYVWTQGGLDNIITLLMNQLDGSGPPPAEKAVIEALPTVKIDQQLVDGHVQCHVCMEDFLLDEEVRQMPCKHLFHSDCIVPWLELHGTCPICRQSLDSQSSTTIDSGGGAVSTQSSFSDENSVSNAGNTEYPDNLL